MPTNLKLPICPKCYKTETVETGTQLLSVFATQFACSECKIHWWGESRPHCESITGTVVDEHGEWHRFDEKLPLRRYEI